MTAEIVASIASLGVLLIVVLCGRGVIPRGVGVGLRTAATSASDAAWRAGHRAAVAPVALSAIIAGGMSLWSVLSGSGAPWRGTVAVAAVVTGVIVGAAMSDRNARDVQPRPAIEREEPGPGFAVASDKRPALARRMSAAVLLWLPVAGVFVARAAGPVPPANVPTHWSVDGVPDTFANPDVTFWWSLGPAMICAFVGTIVVLASGREPWSIGGAVGFGALALVGGCVSLQWLVSVLVGTAGRSSGSPSPFLIYLAGPVLGISVFLLAAPRPSSSRRDRVSRRQDRS